MAVGGYTTVSVRCTEEYDGSTESWSTGAVLPTPVRCDLAGTGIQNAALVFGGRQTSPTLAIIADADAYDGGAWSSCNPMITARCALAGAGTQGAALAIGGNPSSARSCTEEFDGTNWASGGALTAGTFCMAAAGTQNEAIVFGGQPSYPSEEYDGSTWSSGGRSLRQKYAHAGAGLQNAALAFGGYAPTLDSYTEEYNGATCTPNIRCL